MSSLHWICALTLALACCLSAQPVKRSLEKDRLLGLIEHFKNITKGSDCTNDTKPFSPSDMKPECVTSALDCTLKGLDLIEDKCEIDKEKEFLIERIYTGLKNKWHIPPRPDCDCEQYPQKSMEDFLNDVKVLVQQLV